VEWGILTIAGATRLVCAQAVTDRNNRKQ